MTTDSNKLNEIMAQCYGTENYYREYLLSYLYTDGVKEFAMNAGGGAYWFLQEVNGMIVDNKIRQSDDYLTTIHLIVKNGKADIVMENDDKKYTKHISCTDCPDGDWVFYFDSYQNVLLWHGEY